MHTDCEKGMRILRDENLYFNDEELDAYKGIAAEDYSEAQEAEIREVFETLRIEEISDWVCAMQARNIALPLSVREEALMMLETI